MGKGQAVTFLLLFFLFVGGCKSLLRERRPIGICGDHLIQEIAGEECDDGNTIAGDGCSPQCNIEVCGNGVKDPQDECDDGLLNDDSGSCTTKCTLARCGDTYLKLRGTGPKEICDDGNTDNGDGCNPAQYFSMKLPSFPLERR